VGFIGSSDDGNEPAVFVCNDGTYNDNDDVGGGGWDGYFGDFEVSLFPEMIGTVHKLFLVDNDDDDDMG